MKCIESRHRNIKITFGNYGTEYVNRPVVGFFTISKGQKLTYSDYLHDIIESKSQAKRFADFLERSAKTIRRHMEV